MQNNAKPSEIPSGIVVHVHDKGLMEEVGMKLLNECWIEGNVLY